MAHAVREQEVSRSAKRWPAVDALRGFAILCIIGLAGAASALGHMAQSAPVPLRIIGDFASRQFSHARWEGLTFYDLIFALFVFIMGVGISCALSRPAAEEGAAVYFKVLRRSMLMYALGLIYYGVGAQHWADVRYVGVLQRLALCYLFTSYLVLMLAPLARAACVAAILLIYWALMSFVAAPGIPAGSLAPDLNLADWIDRQLLCLAGYGTARMIQKAS